MNANHNPIRLFYLFGKFSKTGWWYYFEAAFLVKATIPLLFTTLLASIHLAVKRFIDPWGEAIILGAILSYMLALTLGADDIGVRYLLPLFPLLFIWGSRIVTELQHKTVGIALVLLLAVLQARTSLAAFRGARPERESWSLE